MAAFLHASSVFVLLLRTLYRRTKTMSIGKTAKNGSGSGAALSKKLRDRLEGLFTNNPFLSQEDMVYYMK